MRRSAAGSQSAEHISERKGAEIDGRMSIGKCEVLGTSGSKERALNSCPFTSSGAGIGSGLAPLPGMKPQWMRARSVFEAKQAP